MIDLVLAGDNAVVIGLAAAGLPLQQRTKAVLLGIIAATILRITIASGIADATMITSPDPQFARRFLRNTASAFL